MYIIEVGNIREVFSFTYKVRVFVIFGGGRFKSIRNVSSPFSQ